VIRMERMLNIFVLGIAVVIFGALINVFAYTMLPVQIQSQADLLNEDISGVSLSASQTNLVNRTADINVLVYLFIGTMVILVGVILVIYTGFKQATGKGKF